MKTVIFALARFSPRLAYWLMVVINMISIMVLQIGSAVKEDLRGHWLHVVFVALLVLTGGIASGAPAANAIIVTSIVTALVLSVRLIMHIGSWVVENGFFAGLACMTSAANSLGARNA